MFSKLGQFYKLITNNNCTYFKANRSRTTSFKFCFFYHRSKTNSSTNIMPVSPLLLLPKCLAIHCMNVKEGGWQCSFLSFLQRKPSLTIIDNSDVYVIQTGYHVSDTVSMWSPGDILKSQRIGKDICPGSLPDLRILVVLCLLD